MSWALIGPPEKLSYKQFSMIITHLHDGPDHVLFKHLILIGSHKN